MAPKRSTGNGCDAGFVADTANGYCYTVLPDVTDLENGKTICGENFDADLLQFENDTHVTALLAILKSSEKKNFFVN
jgi:hypothetical protein